MGLGELGSFSAPRGQLQTAIVCTVQQTGFGQGTAEKGQTAQTDGSGLALDPSVMTCYYNEEAWATGRQGEV